jgi:peptidoglycan/LPS O-acetylase OafA/YrhL
MATTPLTSKTFEMTERSAITDRTIPSLDGLRAISIVLVLFGHLGGTEGFLVARHASALYIAQIGVRSFFVISGFLITSILLVEVEKSGRVALGSFYLRRICRLTPAFYVYLATVSIMNGLAHIGVPWRDIAMSGTYLINYVGDRSWWIAHAWSLGVEEQFYLTWPICLRFAGPRRVPIIAAVVIVAAPLLRTVSPPSIRAYALFTAGDAIAMGCLLACLRQQLRKSKAFVVLTRVPQLLILCALTGCATIPAYLMFRFDRQGAIFALASSAVNLSIAMCILLLVEQPHTVAGVVFNCPAARLIGRASYSLYLWQQFFLNSDYRVFVTRFPVNVICACAVAVVSYRFIEKPGIRFGLRFKRVRAYEL